ncbi:MAG TPA: helix-turn-helix domain-containing protein [bacterium]|nr:helix-turn-helix domain-containing protein [bacterium]
MAGHVARDLITVRDAARQCHRTTETVRRWIWEGKLPAQKLGNQLFIKRADLARVARPEKNNRAEEQLALLERIQTLRERIARRMGRMAGVLEALDRSRESHP